MAVCPYGKASACFPLAMGRDAVFGVIAAANVWEYEVQKSTQFGRMKRSVTESQANTASEAVLLRATVAGYTTQKTHEAGACSVRLDIQTDSRSLAPVGAGAYLVALRAKGRAGWLPGIAAPRCGGVESNVSGLEVIVFGRPDANFTALMYLPEDTLRILFPEDSTGTLSTLNEDDDDFDTLSELDSELGEDLAGSAVEVRLIRHLLPVQRDCPPQWLRDRLLRLADIANESFCAAAGFTAGGREELRAALERAGLALVEGQAQVVPLNGGSEDELGYWNEEMKSGVHCAAGVEGLGHLEGIGFLDEPADLGELPERPMLCVRQISKESISKESLPSTDLNDSRGDQEATSSNTDSSTPRSQGVSASDCVLDDNLTAPKDAHSGDGYDTRWLDFGTNYKTLHADCSAGDGTITNVGLNVSGTFRCTLCVQQFGAQPALNVHMKFFHQVDRNQEDWLCYPSA